jgi:hypothetical protein
MLAPDGTVVWIIEDNGLGRSMFLQNDRFHVYKKPASSPP